MLITKFDKSINFAKVVCPGGDYYHIDDIPT